ncbi:MAG: 2-C-methyl-D-erythritol 4-phosphate cytidylyltransferase [Solobacterium sp.]|nr:2-C-methyl-D-erythritol 4-phosphate cytidylyltransferase [Solobacterium sp.]
MEYSAVIVAAGSGTRMGLGYNKAYYRIDDRTILEHTMQIFLDDPECLQVIAVTDSQKYMEEITGFWPGKITLVRGGRSRMESVSNGLNAVLCDTVMIHDGARPYLSRECLDALKKAMETEQAACLTVPCKDTIKKVSDGYLTETVERSTIAAAQTPQVFRTDLIISCMNRALQEGYTGTDDCSLVERYSYVPIRAVEGSYENIKITTPEDLKQKGL